MANATTKTPKADVPRCDTPGCGRFAAIATDGTEKDVQGLNRPAIPNLNVCNAHTNWPHSNDAAAWAADPTNAEKLKARK